jgi:hypothetical protein
MKIGDQVKIRRFKNKEEYDKALGHIEPKFNFEAYDINFSNYYNNIYNITEIHNRIHSGNNITTYTLNAIEIELYSCYFFKEQLIQLTILKLKAILKIL